MSDLRTSARVRALRTARVVTLGLALSATAGCEAATDAYCGVFSETETCCRRVPRHTWNASSHRCEPTPLPPFVGPMVPPS